MKSFLQTRYIILIGLFFLLGPILKAQVPADPKKKKDFFQIKSPSIEYKAPDADDLLFEEDIKDTNAVREEMEKGPVRTPALPEEDDMGEDSAFFDDEEGELSVVEVNEQVNLDSNWITIAQYYAIWDSRTINPYKIDGADFKDTLRMTLYDSLAGLGWSMPLDQIRVTSHFGFRKIRWHYGTDLGLIVGEPVRSVFDGIVRIVSYDARGYGRYVVIRHYNGFETLYGHMSAVNVQIGQYVKAGEQIGKGGNTGRSSGPHLHFEVRYEGNAIDAEKVFDFQNNNLRTKTFYLMPEHFNYLKEARKVFYHTVRSGDSLGKISKKYGVPVSKICQLNGIRPSTTLKVGRRLRIR
jgi:murein DD-endopeptidase MepM/ murein hydrolase activator NlpD